MRLHNLPAKKQQRKLSGRKFRRQHSIGPYILDFYCPAEKLAVELDGSSHDSETAQAHDDRRADFLSKLGIRIVRFENKDVRKNLEGVLTTIERAFNA